MSKRARTEETSFRTSTDFLVKLVTTHAESLTPPDRKVFTAERTDKVTAVWKGLIKHNFLSVPVLQKTKHRYYGFLDMADIVQLVLDTFTAETLSKDFDIWAYMEKEDAFLSKTVNEVMKYPRTKKNVFHPISRGYSLFSVLEILSKERGLHRVAVIDEQFNLVNIITESQVLRFLHSNMKELGSIKDKPVSDLNMTKEKMILVKETDSAVDAFKKMITENVSGLGVVNEHGKLVENISLRDLKAVQHDGRMMWRLHQSCKHFLEKVRNETPEERRPSHVICVTPKDKFSHVIQLSVNHGIHRIYVVDEEKKPIGVISLKDILGEIITHV